MRLLIFSFTICLLTACSKPVTKQELLNYTFEPGNGLLKKEEKGGAVAEALYKPSDLITYQEVKDQKFTKAQIDSVRSYYQNFSYFLLRLSKNGKEITISYAGDETRFVKANDYLSFQIGKDVHLIAGSDTLDVQDFVHTRTFGASPSSDVLFVFKTDLKKQSGKVKLIFDDQQFGLGLTEFFFDCNDIKSSPSLDFNL